MTEESPPTEPVTVGVPRETEPGERRVALIPETVGRLARSGIAVVIETGAGAGSFHSDDEYAEAGAIIVGGRAEVHEAADIIARVRPPQLADVEYLRAGTVLISFLDPSRATDVIHRLEKHGVVAFSFNRVPRITRAQSMDAMSSMATIAGYKAVLLAADTIGRMFPLLMTAAGTISPSRVLVLGAGVAGLQALATARRLGAVTEGFDTRAAVREQVQSVGAKFVEMPPELEHAEGEGGYAKSVDEAFLDRERDAIRTHVAQADVVITTAAVPGARAPLLIDDGMVASMRPGSVIVDLAAETGGNCTVTAPGDTLTFEGVTVIGPIDLPRTIPVHASQLYSRNVAAVVMHLVKEGNVNLDFSDEITRGACVTGAGVKP